MAESASIPLPEREHPVTKRSRWRVFGWLAGILLLVLSVVPISWLVIRWRTQREIDAELARIRAAGEPASFEEVIDSIPPLAAEKDCTQMYDEVFAIITSQRFQQEAGPFPYIGNGDVNEELIPPPGTDWPGLAAAAEFVDAQSHLFYTLDRAAELGGECRWPWSLEDVASSSFVPVSVKARHAEQLLRLRAVIASHRRNSGDVHRALTSLGALQNCLASDPHTVSLLARIFTYEAYLHQTAQLLGEVHFSDQQYHAMQLTGRSVDFQKQFHRAMLRDRLVDAQVFDHFPSTDEYGWPSDVRFVKPVWWWRVTSHADAWAYWRATGRICEAAKFSDVVKANAAIRRVQRDVLADIERAGYSGRRYFVTHGVVKLAYLAPTAIVRITAANRAFDAIVACYRHKLQHGDFPENLDVLVPEYLPAIPTDPYASAPIRYIHQDGQIVVYCTGDDGQDAGGMLRYEDANVDDIGFRSNAWKRTYEAAQAKLQGSTSDVEEPSPNVEGFAAPAE